MVKTPNNPSTAHREAGKTEDTGGEHPSPQTRVSGRLGRKPKNRKWSDCEPDGSFSKDEANQAREFKTQWPRKTRKPSDGGANLEATSTKVGTRPPKHSSQKYGRHKGPARARWKVARNQPRRLLVRFREAEDIGWFWRKAERRRAERRRKTRRRAEKGLKTHGPMLRLSLRSASDARQGRADDRAAITDQRGG